MHARNTYVTLMMPFSYHEHKKFKLYEALKAEQYDFFTLDRVSLEHQYYGDISILHEALDQHFLPYVERRLFPKEENPENFLRYSKVMNQTMHMSIHDRTYTFHVLSVDIVLCPFQVGFITMRVKLPDTLPLKAAIDFFHHMRILEPKLPDEKGMCLFNENRSFESVSDFTFRYLCGFMHDFMNHDAIRGGYFGSLPFFEDERMLIGVYTELSEKATVRDLYRLSQLDGVDCNGDDMISAENEDYMKRYLRDHVDDRFSPKLTKVITGHAYLSIIQPEADCTVRNAAQVRFMGIDYYQLLLHYFYKLTLLKLSYQYSEVSILHDQDYTEQLIEQIDQFSASYYFNEISSRSTGIELANHLSRVFKVPEQYEEVKNTLESLYRTQQSASERKQNGLLFMLTIFTVMSGIYGMNLVVEQWGDGYKWSALKSYKLFEWIAYFIAIAGIGMSLIVIVTSSYRKLHSMLKKWRHRKYE